MAKQQEPATVLQYLIWQRKRTYEEIVSDLAEHKGTVSVRHLGRMVRGERPEAGTTPSTFRALQALFGLPAEELLRPWTPDLVIHAAPATDGQMVLPSPGNERSVLTMAANRARQFSQIAANGGTSAEAVEQLRDEVQRLALAYPQRPLSEILGDLAETQDTIFTLLEGRQRPSTARQLHFLASVTSGLLAKASHDLAEPQAAMLQARTAVLCADQADHDGLRAWLRGLQSLVSYWAGRYAESVRYAERGSLFAAQAGGTSAVWLPISAARAYAALGNAEKANDAIRTAEEAWSRVEPDDLDELGGICTFSQPRTLYYAADALAWLPSEAVKAADYSQQAVTAYADESDPAWAFGDQAGSHADLAIARISGEHPDLNGATEAISPVLALPPTRRINGIVHSTKRVHRAIIQAGLAEEGRDLLEEIELFSHNPVSARPR